MTKVFYFPFISLCKFLTILKFESTMHWLLCRAKKKPTKLIFLFYSPQEPSRESDKRAVEEHIVGLKEACYLLQTSNLGWVHLGLTLLKGNIDPV